MEEESNTILDEIQRLQKKHEEMEKMIEEKEKRKEMSCITSPELNDDAAKIANNWDRETAELFLECYRDRHPAKIPKKDKI